MDLGGNYSNFGRGGNSQRSLFKKLTQRLPFRGQLAIGVIFLVLFYWVFFSGGSSNADLDDSSDGYYPITENSKSPIPDHSNNEIDFLRLKNFELAKPYINPSRLSLFHYTNGGNMMLSKNADMLRLTPAKPNQVGYIFSNERLSQEHSDALEIEVEFRIHGDQPKSSLIGDGMAIWLTDHQLKQGDVFGMQSDYHGLGLFLDTFKNGRKRRSNHEREPGINNRLAKTRNNQQVLVQFPYLSLQDNNGQLNKYSRYEDGEPTELAGCSMHKVYNLKMDNELINAKMRILFIRKLNYLSVEYDFGHGYKECFEINNEFEINIPASPYFGISSENGELFENVDLYSVQISSLRDSKTGGPISSITTLKEAVNYNEASDEKDLSDQTKERINKRRNRRDSKMRNQQQKRDQRRKLINKERSSGSGDGQGGFWRGLMKLIWVVVKLTLYLFFILLILYFGLLGFRVFKEKQRKKNSRSIL